MDNNNKNNYDEFFKNEGNSNASESNDNTEINNGESQSSYNVNEQQRGQSQQQQPIYGQSPYSNSYETDRNQAPNVQDAEYRSVNANNEPTANGPSTQQTQDDAMYYYTYGNAGPNTTTPSSYQQPVYGNQATTPVYNEQNQVPPNYRPFTVSQGAGNDGSGKGREKQKGSGFGKVFLSFMAGVIAVGLLMYTADVQNWFSTDSPVSTQSSTLNNGSNESEKTTVTEKGSSVSSNVMEDRPTNIASLFKSASPAVVKIETYSSYSSGRGGSNSLLDDPFFRQFFGDSIPKSNSGGNGSNGEMEQTGMGTGFFFDETGYILTNQHVIGDADEIRVVVEGYDKPLVAELLGSSYELDLAVLKVTSDEPFPTLPLGSSEDIKIGDWVVAIGNPYGFDHTLTVGVLSAKERPIDISDTEGTRNYENLLQTDASINPGNSGGPLLNLNGEVIGINTAVSSTAQGIGFAIPTSTITEVLDSLKNNKAIPKAAAPFIGAELQDITDVISEELGLSSTEGTIVRSVYYNSPAYIGDLKQFDVITGVDNESIKTTQALIDYIKTKEVGTTIELKIIRNNKNMTLSVNIGDKNEFGLK